MAIMGDSLCLEEEDPPVSCPEVEDIGSLAVVKCPCGKRMMDANSVLQLLFCQCLPWLILLLQVTGCFRASLGMHRPISQLYKAAVTAGKCWQWWALEIILHQAAAGSAPSSHYTHGERLHNLGTWAWQQRGGCSTALQLGSVCACRRLHLQPKPPPTAKTLVPPLSPSQAPTCRALVWQPPSPPPPSPGTLGIERPPDPQARVQAGMVLSLIRVGFAMLCMGAPLLLWGLL